MYMDPSTGWVRKFDAPALIDLNSEPLEPEAYEARLREIQDSIVDAWITAKESHGRHRYHDW